MYHPTLGLRVIKKKKRPEAWPRRRLWRAAAARGSAPGDTNTKGRAVGVHLKPSRPRLVPARPKGCTRHVREPLRFPKWGLGFDGPDALFRRRLWRVAAARCSAPGDTDTAGRREEQVTSPSSEDASGVVAPCEPENRDSPLEGRLEERVVQVMSPSTEDVQVTSPSTEGVVGVLG